MALRAIAAGFREALLDHMARQGLRGSELQKSVQVKVTDAGLEVFMNEYWRFVEGGRRAFARKVPIQILIGWMRKVGISARPGQSLQSIAFAIQTSIYQKGINPRPFVKPAIAELDSIVEALADDLVSGIWQDVVAQLATA